MALVAQTVWEAKAGSTAGNVNGGGFNPANANFMTDLTTDTNTANTSAPVVSSASYNFVAGDVGNWLYIKSGTNWTPGWYKIASVAANKATLSAAVGSASVVQVVNGVSGTAHGIYGTNTVIGCATVGTPTGGVFAVDYSQATAAIVNGLTDLTCTAASTTVTSATAPFKPSMVGNLIHLTALTGTGAIVGWYEVVSYTNTSNIVLDRTPTNGVNNITAGTFYVGGALSMNSTLDDDVTEAMIAGNRWFLTGSLSIGEAVTTALAGTVAAPIIMEGYNAQRGDNPTGSTRPTLNCGANAYTSGTYWYIYNIIFTGSAASMFTTGTDSVTRDCKFENTSRTTLRTALVPGTTSVHVGCEFVSYRGYGETQGTNLTEFIGCYAHDSSIGFRYSGTGTGSCRFYNCISANNQAHAWRSAGSATGLMILYNCTAYGAENKTGVGAEFTSGNKGVKIHGCIFYGFTTAISYPDTSTELYSEYNDYYNNTANFSAATQYQKGVYDQELDPGFLSVSQITGSGATSSTNVLTDGSKDFVALGVVAGDYIYVVSGTGTGFDTGTYLISNVTTTTLTLSSNLTTSGSGSSIVYQLTLGRNFGLGTNLKALGFPGAFVGSNTTGYMDIGAVQREEPAGGGGGASSFTFS